jgi:hypothetical protein
VSTCGVPINADLAFLRDGKFFVAIAILYSAAGMVVQGFLELARH